MHTHKTSRSVSSEIKNSFLSYEQCTSVALNSLQAEQLQLIKWLSVTLIMFLYLEGQDTYLRIFFLNPCGCKTPFICTFIIQIHLLRIQGPEINEVVHLGGINLLRIDLQIYANTTAGIFFSKGMFKNRHLNISAQIMFLSDYWMCKMCLK